MANSIAYAAAAKTTLALLQALNLWRMQVVEPFAPVLWTEAPLASG